ncbi:hypothetical protein BH10BAC4_BH10BAC4_17680 [soil metagenome]
MKSFAPLLIFIFILIPILGISQPGDPGGDPDVPITGIEFLLGGGLLLGVRKIISNFKSKKGIE